MTREPLPQRRRSETVTYMVGGLTYNGSIGFYADGRIGEIFSTAPSLAPKRRSRPAIPQSSRASPYSTALL